MRVRDQIQPEGPGDYAAVDRLLREAFECDAEAVLVQELRSQVTPVVSLVATADTEMVGYVMLSPVTIQGPRADCRGMGLGPLAVAHTHRGRGLGGQLVRSGLNACHQRGFDVAFVLGHPDYYQRFGFQVAAPLGLHYRSAELDPWFLVKELSLGRLAGVRGMVRYHRLFNSV